MILELVHGQWVVIKTNNIYAHSHIHIHFYTHTKKRARKKKGEKCIIDSKTCMQILKYANINMHWLYIHFKYFALSVFLSLSLPFLLAKRAFFSLFFH